MSGTNPPLPRAAVVFDLDGTLLNSLEDLADSMNAVLRRAGFPAHPVDAYRYFVGDGIEALVQRALPEAGQDSLTFSSCLADMRREYAARADAKTRPYPGIPDLLSELGAKGVPMAILSNKPHHATLDVVRLLLNRWPFHPVLGARPGIPKKPNPAGALEIARSLGIERAKIIYVGDTDTDMQTAAAAGMHPAGALWGFRSEEELLRSGARTLLAHPMDLLNYV